MTGLEGSIGLYAATSLEVDLGMKTDRPIFPPPWATRKWGARWSATAWHEIASLPCAECAALKGHVTKRRRVRES